MVDISTWLPPILGVGVVQGILLVLVLIFAGKGNRKALAMLALVVLLYTGSLFNGFVVFGGYYQINPHLVLVFYPFDRLIGPGFYLFVLLLINPTRSFKWYDLIHSIPAIYQVRSMWWFYKLPTDAKINAIENMWSIDNIMNFQYLLVASGWEAHTMVYILAAIIVVGRKLRELKYFSSNTNLDFYAWIKKLSVTFLVFLIISLVSLIVVFFANYPASRTEVVIQLFITFLIHYIAFITIQQPQKLFYQIKIPDDKSATPKSNIAISKSTISTLMLEQKPFLDPNLKIHQLASMLDVTPHQLSRVINQEYGVNFFDFINDYRIDEFKERATTKALAHLTLLGIAFQVGFNSKSSFNRIFKKREGMTPSQFLKQRGANF